MIGGVGGHLRKGMSRGDAKELGELLEGGEAALVVIGESRVEEQLDKLLTRAEKTLGPGRVKYVHPDCGFWMLKRTIADGKMRALVRGRDLFEGRAG